jgi:hypothetical protein
MSIYIEKGNLHELHISFTYDYERVRRIKEIKGVRWNPERKYWILPNSVEIIRELVIKFYDEEVIVDPSIDLEGY